MTQMYPVGKARAWCVVVCIAALAGGCGEASKSKAENATDGPTAAVVKVTRGNLADNLEIASEFEPFQEVDVFAKVSGYIHKLNVDVGAHVKKGQMLAELEIPELQQQLQQDEAMVRRSEQDLARAREELNRAQSAYSVAHITYTRLADVQKTRPELVAQQEIDVAQGKDLEAGSNVSSEKAALAAAEQGLQVAQATLGKDQAMFDYAHMTAPFDGVVTQIYAYTGALLPAGTSSSKGDSALCRLSQNTLLRLVIPVPERAVSDIHLGETVSVNVSGITKIFDGKIVRFSDQIDTATRTMHTEVDVPNPRLEIVSGMYASVKIPLHSVSNVLMLPVQAIQTTGEGNAVVLLVDKSQHVERRAVKIGLQMAAQAEILSGVENGDLIIFGEQNQFRPGELVTPKSVDAPGAEK